MPSDTWTRGRYRVRVDLTMPHCGIWKLQKALFGWWSPASWGYLQTEDPEGEALAILDEADRFGSLREAGLPRPRRCTVTPRRV